MGDDPRHPDPGTRGAPSELSFRPPLVLRVYVVALLAFWVVVVGRATLIHKHGGSVAIGVLFLAVGIAIACQSLRLGVWCRADGTLTVHNNLGGRRLTRSEVEEFRLGVTGGGRFGQRGAHALLRDGTTYQIDVCRRPAGIGRRGLQTQVDELNAWLRAGQVR